MYLPSVVITLWSHAETEDFWPPRAPVVAGGRPAVPVGPALAGRPPDRCRRGVPGTRPERGLPRPVRPAARGRRRILGDRRSRGLPALRHRHSSAPLPWAVPVRWLRRGTRPDLLGRAGHARDRRRRRRHQPARAAAGGRPAAGGRCRSRRDVRHPLPVAAGRETRPTLTASRYRADHCFRCG